MNCTCIVDKKLIIIITLFFLIYDIHSIITSSDYNEIDQINI